MVIRGGRGLIKVPVVCGVRLEADILGPFSCDQDEDRGVADGVGSCDLGVG